MKNNLNNIPAWMTDPDYPIPEVKDYVQKVQQIQQKEIPKQPVQNNNTSNQISDGKSREQNEGTVLLVWKQNGNDQPILEDNEFPTKSLFSIAKFEDFESTDQMKKIVKEFQTLIDKYNARQNKGGIYAIFVGKLAKGIKKVVVETDEVEF